MSFPLCLLFVLHAAGETTPAANRQPAAVANNEFAVDVYRQLAQEEGNLFFSPVSVCTALAMTYAGADGQTAKEMADVLHFPPEPAQVHPAFGALLTGLGQGTEEGPYRLDVANALWLQDKYNFLQPFLDTVQQHYDAGLYTVNFAAAAEAARKQINDWVEKKTENKIEDLIPAGALDASTRLVLTNAIYFKGDWVRAFDKAHTQDEPFHVSAEREVQAPLMHQQRDFEYFRGEGFQGLSLPYRGEELAMLVLLPDETGGLAGLEQSLTAANLDEWRGRLESKRVVVTLPRFKATSQFQLNDVLAGLGMKSAFTGEADFSKMAGARDLFISAVLHKAYADVNEEGTEAAAATGVVISKTAMPARPVEFRADHPFVFMIYEKETGAVLFMGRLVDPTA